MFVCLQETKLTVREMLEQSPVCEWISAERCHWSKANERGLMDNSSTHSYKPTELHNYSQQYVDSLDEGFR